VRVGYADAFGFSAAFKRHKGLSPSAFRAAAA
jgi:AraC-like DNA-binding protein